MKKKIKKRVVKVRKKIVKNKKVKKKSGVKTNSINLACDDDIERVPWGIPEIDKVTEGGLERGSVNLLAGSAGAGKSILSTQFIVDGIERYGEAGVYVCFEEEKERFFKHMLRFGWDLAKYEKEKKLVYLEYTPEQVKKMIDEGGGLIEAVITKIKAKRLVIDSISAFSLLFGNEFEKKEATLSLFEILRKFKVTSIVTGEYEEYKLEKQEIGDIIFEADSVFLLYFIKDKNVRKRAIEILKMRGTRHSEKLMLMDIGPKGIKVYLNEEVF